MEPSLQPDLVFPTTRSSCEDSSHLWGACAALSVALHLSVLTLIALSGAPPVTDGHRTSGPVSYVASLSDAHITEIETPQALPERLSPLPPLVPNVPKMLAMREGDWMRSAFDESVYVAAKHLTTRPVAAEYISVPYPKDEATNRGALKTILAIYIDEDGTVAHVRIHGASLPQAFERSALDTFARARFHPGRVGDKAVKSRMLIEVEFANELTNATTPQRLTALPDKR
jgi:TonB family protein